MGNTVRTFPALRENILKMTPDTGPAVTTFMMLRLNPEQWMILTLLQNRDITGNSREQEEHPLIVRLSHLCRKGKEYELQHFQPQSQHRTDNCPQHRTAGKSDKETSQTLSFTVTAINSTCDCLSPLTEWTHLHGTGKLVYYIFKISLPSPTQEADFSGKM